MIVMGAELEVLACEALGRSWKKMLAKELGCTKRTVLNACKSRKGVPVGMQQALLRVISKRRDAQKVVSERLSGVLEDAA